MNARYNLAVAYPDFSPGPTSAEMNRLFRIVPALPEDAKANEEIRKRFEAIRTREDFAISENTTAESFVSAPH